MPSTKRCRRRTWPPSGKAGKSKGRCKPGKGKEKAYLVSEGPLFFSLGSENDAEAGFCNMVYEGDGEMEQDAGKTELDDKRKTRDTEGPSEWSVVSPVSPGTYGYTTAPEWEPPMPEEKAPETLAQTIYIPTGSVEKLTVPTFASARPAALDKLKVRELQCDCDRWGVATSGTKEQIHARIERFYQGLAVEKKGCTRRFVQLEELGSLRLPPRSTMPLRLYLNVFAGCYGNAREEHQEGRRPRER